MLFSVFMLVVMLVTPLANAYAAAPAAASFDTSAASLFSTGGNDTPENQFYSLTTNNFSNLEVVSSKNIFGADHFANKGNVIDANLGNAATWGYLVGGTAWIEVRANSATGGNAFQPGTYAGFVLGDTNIGVGSQIRVTTYLGDTQQESQIVSGSLLVDLGGGKYKGGFWAAQPFNRVRLTATGILGVGTVSVYYAEVFKPKAGPEPACNVYTNLNQPTYGALIGLAHGHLGRWPGHRLQYR
ncbi:MAG: hypothetical protein HZY76_19785 [Anaerolineae bacterium]|nr:MAG: hypothetical protein HZY76_19785 [Anaerolineae bacterium]